VENDSNYIELFAQEQRRKNLSEGTIRVRTGQLAAVRAGFGSFDVITRRTLEKWLNEQQHNTRTQRSYISTLAEFFKWGMKCNFFEEDPTERISRPEISAKVQEIRDEDVARVLGAATKPALRSWLALMAYQGLRCKEVAALTAGAIDLDARPPTLALDGGASAQRKSSILHSEVIASLNAMPVARGRLFPEEDSASVSRKIARHFTSCEADGSSNSLLWWYRSQVQKFGQNFDRDTSAHLSDEPELTPIEMSIMAALDQQVPGESSCYRQATRDLNDPSRIAFRGVATEYRELVRVVLDRLAPDDIVKASPGFKLEQDQIKPTQVQKTRFILKSHGVSDTARHVPETTIDLIEEHVGTFARNIYRRTSNSLHTDTDRSDVKQIKMYVDALLSEILQVHRPI
jgi:hypothetical protein